MRNFAARQSSVKLMPHRSTSLLSKTLLLLVLLAKPECSQTPALPGPVKFTDTTKAAGITFVHFKGNQGTAINLEEFGPGVCVADFDSDAWPDIYFVNGRDRYNRGISVQNALYRNNKDGTFTDVTDKAGVPGTGYGLGCVWGDYDNDGSPDLFVTQYGRNVLYHNNGNGTFTDVTDKAGVAGLESGKFHSGATFFDYDRDGLLDLYVGSYVQLEPDGPLYCNVGTVKSSCAPQAYQGSPNALYHNNGDGTFTNVTKAVGVYQPNGKNLAVGAGDYDNDGWPDLFVANDGIPAYLFHNDHGKFTETAASADMAYNQDGKEMAAMCVSLGDYDNDGWLDLYISDFQAVGDHLWRNDHRGHMHEVTGQAGIFLPTLNVLSFGGGFLDYDNDGWLDLFIANGHVYPEVESFPVHQHYRQLNSLFHNSGANKFDETTEAAGIAALPPRVGRGVAFADFDNDGSVDIIVANNDDPPTLLHNSGSSNHFLNLKLVGTKSNRDALGARIRVVAGGISQIRDVAGGGSYLSQSDLRANFGLGKSAQAEKVEIKWPSGQVDTFGNVKADNFYIAVEGGRELQLQKFSRIPAQTNTSPAH
jgi:enediyne biosynthesis protein E4